MAQDRYGIYPASFQYAGPTTLNLQQLHGVSLKPDNKKDTVIPGGSIDPAAIMLISAAPVVSFKTHDLATILTGVSLTAGLQTIANSLLQFQKRADGGAFAGTLAHVVLTNNKGMLIPKRLTVSKDKPAELEIDWHCQYDGTTSGTPAVPVPPLTIAANQTLTSTPEFNARFYQGPVYANAVQAPSITEWEADFGIEYETMILDGDVWAQVGSIKSRKPKITFSILKVDYANTIGSLFNAALPGALALYARKGTAGGLRVSDATAQHIKISAATGAWNADSIDVSEQDDATLRVTCDATGTLAANLATAIP